MDVCVTQTALRRSDGRRRVVFAVFSPQYPGAGGQHAQSIRATSLWVAHCRVGQRPRKLQSGSCDFSFT